MLPTSIEILHDLENHEHTICTSTTEQHIHKQNLDCDEFHKQITFYAFNFPTRLDVIPTHFYTSIFIDTPQIDNVVYQSTRTKRGPPKFTA